MCVYVCSSSLRGCPALDSDLLRDLSLPGSGDQLLLASLSALSASPLSTTDLGYASRIVRWLVRQQNAYGGFFSTQVYFKTRCCALVVRHYYLDFYQITGMWVLLDMSSLVRLTSTEVEPRNHNG